MRALLILLLALPAAASDDVDTYLSGKSADKAVSVDAGGLHSDSTVAGSSAPARGSVRDEGLQDAKLEKGSTLHQGLVVQRMIDSAAQAAKASGGTSKSAQASGATVQTDPSYSFVIPPASKIQLHQFDYQQAVTPRVQAAPWFGAMSFNSDLDVYSVAIMTRGHPDGSRGSGNCGAVVSPGVASPSPCIVNLWISAEPGGPPVSPACAMATGADAFMLPFFVSDKPAGGECDVKPLTAYWCNYSATGWPRTIPVACGRALSSPLGEAGMGCLKKGATELELRRMTAYFCPIWNADGSPGACKAPASDLYCPQ